MVSSAFALVSLLAASGTVSAQFTYKTLAEDRAANVFQFVPYTLEQKTAGLNQVEALMQTWVNLQSKLDYYPNGKTADPFPKIASLRAKLQNVTDTEFHLTLSNAFANARDGQ
ncbi:hypothetical protein BC831DRAFT_506632 [Entophlyctis helioformis]|nr:hypothetical protein BC831DRAFT_507588 [Entophlyctis helioformis]KAI8921640.1 hypothetical protein BC831DRAFT_506632 [Entophlyctis helioformis]